MAAEEDHPAHLALTVSHQDPSCDEWLNSLDPAHREKVTLKDWTKTFHSTFRNGCDRINLDLAPNLVRGPSLLALAGNARDDGPQNWHLNFRLHNETTTPRTMAVALCQGHQAEGGTLFYSTIRPIPTGVPRADLVAIAECFQDSLDILVKGHLGLFKLQLKACTENTKFKACKESAPEANGTRAYIEGMKGFWMHKKHPGATNHFYCS